MEVKKITYEEALARWKRSLEIKRAAEKRMAEEWARRGITGTIVSLWYSYPFVENRNPLLETIIADFEMTAQALTEGKP